MGDFNIVLGAHKRSSVTLYHRLPSNELRDFIADIDLMDIEAKGKLFTWSAPRSSGYLVARLDRALATHEFLNMWNEVELLVLSGILLGSSSAQIICLY